MQSNITPQDLSRMLQSEGYKAKIKVFIGKTD